VHAADVNDQPHVVVVTRAQLGGKQAVVSPARRRYTRQYTRQRLHLCRTTTINTRRSTGRIAEGVDFAWGRI